MLHAGDSRDAVRDFLCHGSHHLEQHVDGLRPELKRAVQLIFLLRQVSLDEVRSHVSVLKLDLLDVGVELGDVARLEGHVFVVN